jgi:hypothetical protein
MILGVSGMHVPKMILHIMSDSNSMLNVKLERELLRGISDAAIASGNYLFKVSKEYGINI